MSLSVSRFASRLTGRLVFFDNPVRLSWDRLASMYKPIACIFVERISYLFKDLGFRPLADLQFCRSELFRCLIVLQSQS
jgi:hypothetical protein